LLVAGFALILEDQVSIYREHGLGELLQTMSPLNLPYYRAVLGVLVPGAAIAALGQWQIARRRRYRRRRPTYLSDFMLRC
jgi:hypothetical protein